MQQWFRFEMDGAVRVGVRQGTEGPIQIHEGNSILKPGAALGKSADPDQLSLLTPIEPSKFLALWNNFHEMAAKLGNPVPPEPLYFVKAANSFNRPGGAIRKPVSYDGKVVYEGELGIVVGKACTRVSESEAQSAIFGYTCVNDVTALDLIHKDPTFAQWTRAKSCDTFAPFGPCVAQGIDWSGLRVKTVVSGRERQNYPMSDMVFSPPQIVSLLSREVTLMPGDIIACGTSVGVLPMRADTLVEVTIEGIGTLANVFEPSA